MCLVKINNIELEDGKPVRITAELSIEEAAQIARWTGRLTTEQTSQTREIYDSLVGDVFNRYWSDGVDGYMRGDTE